MNPKKAKSFILPTAEKLNVDPELVEAIVDHYWKEIRKSLSLLKAPRIIIANFGTFRIKSLKKLDEQKHIFEGQINKATEDKTFSMHRIRTDVEQRIVEIDAIRSIIIDDNQRKQQIKTKRNDKRNNNSLEK